MKRILITGSAGLIGSEAARFFAARGYHIVGIDNDMRATFFGPEASSKWNLHGLTKAWAAGTLIMTWTSETPSALDSVVKAVAHEIKVVIHTAAQPSHDWAVRDMRQTSQSTLTAL